MGGTLIALGLAAAYLLWPKREQGRGRTLLAERGPTETEGGVSWGGRSLDPRAATSHFLILGTTGSGKTLTINQLMRKELAAIGRGNDTRALIYDAKQDNLSFLASLGLNVDVVTMNPFDSRCFAWDIARDITTPAAALQLASILIPEENSSNRFFSDAARDLLTGVTIALIQRASGTWTLRDIVFAMRRRERMEELLRSSYQGDDLIDAYFREEKTLHNIISTLRSRLAPFEPIAAMWDRAKGRVSLEEWTRGEFVLVLSSNESVRTALDAVNRAIFKRVTELVVSQAESRVRRTWFFLDEVREAGKLPGLTSLLTKGRSKGACAVLGFQDIDGMKEVYGAHLANEICGMCSNKAILRLESPETAAWAAKVFGEYERIEHLRSVSSDMTWSRRNRTKSETRVKADAVLASEFLTLPPTTTETGLSGYYLTPFIGAYRATVPIDAMIATSEHTAPLAEDFVPRPDEEQYLEPWNQSDSLRLGLTALEPTQPREPEVAGRLRLARRGQRAINTADDQLALEDPQRFQALTS